MLYIFSSLQSNKACFITSRVSEENVAAHANDRKVRVFDEESIIKEEEEAAVSGNKLSRHNF